MFIGSEYVRDKVTGEYIRDYKKEPLADNEEIARKKIMTCDFSNLEMRVLAHFSEDKNLIEMFATGADTHGATAVNMFELDCDPSEVKKKYPHLRQAAKILNFLSY